LLRSPHPTVLANPSVDLIAIEKDKIHGATLLDVLAGHLAGALVPVGVMGVGRFLE
jgi:hypothetical protein